MIDTVTISTNYWRIPAPETALSGWLEGAPTPEERQQVIARAVAARASWKPSSAGMALVERLKDFSGCRIRIQFWDSIMLMLPEEGPFPIEVNCKGVVLLQDGEHLQAYMQVTDPTEFPNDDGYSPMDYFQQRPDCNYLLASVSDIYEVSRVGEAQ